MGVLKNFIGVVKRCFRWWGGMLWRHRALWLVCFFISALSIVDVPFSTIFSFNAAIIALYIVAVSSLKSTVVTVVAGALLDKGGWWRLCGGVLLALYALLSLVNAAAFMFYGFGVSRKLIMLLSQTNSAEIAEFLPGLWENVANLLLKPLFIGLVCACALLWLGVRGMRKRWFDGCVGALSVAGCVMIGVMAVCFPSGRTAHFLALRIPKYSIEAYRLYSDLRAIMAMRSEFPNPESVTSRQLAGNIIMVIGESASKDHLSLYGYPLPTTPGLDALKDSLFVFTDAIGSSPFTFSNMERILSFKEDDTTYNDWYKYPSLIDLFSLAGYRTYYISNQERTGLWSNPSGAMAEAADVVNFVGAENGSDALAARYDEAVMAPFKEYYSEPYSHKMFIIHLMGSHRIYKNRYPPEYARFSAVDVTGISGNKPWINMKNAATVAEYDNSIHYTDHLLADIIHDVAQSEVPSLLIHLSDHGEDVYDDGDFNGRGEKFVMVPFIIYANSSYRRLNGDMMDRLNEALDYPISTANVIYPLMTLSGTSYPQSYNPSKDFLSPEFARQKRYMDEQIWKYDLLPDSCRSDVCRRGDWREGEK